MLQSPGTGCGWAERHAVVVPMIPARQDKASRPARSAGDRTSRETPAAVGRAGGPAAASSALHDSPRMALQRQRIEAAFGPAAVTQRLVASIPGGDWKEKNGPKDDKTFINTTLTAHAKVGGKIKRIDFVDFGADFEDTSKENLAITGHGSPAKIGDKTADDIAAYLTDKTKGLKATHRIPGTIFLESCFAAAEEAPKPSLISTVRSRLDTHLGGKDVPTVIGSGGPQITTNLSPHDSGVKDIVKTVVDRDRKGKKFAMAVRVQDCLYTKYFNGGVQVNTLLDGSDDGAKFIVMARSDEAKLSRLKWIFINVVRGTPLDVADYDNIQPGLQADLISHWTSSGYAKQTGRTGAEIFQTGVDLRDPAEQETLMTKPPGDQITEDFVKDLIGRNDYAALEFIFRSNDYPLSRWDAEAWSLMLDWLVSQ